MCSSRGVREGVNKKSSIEFVFLKTLSVCTVCENCEGTRGKASGLGLASNNVGMRRGKCVSLDTCCLIRACEIDIENKRSTVVCVKSIIELLKKKKIYN